MNNLLRTLTASQVKSSSDLKLLLSTVKEGRRQSHDAKLSDPFYDSLEGLLIDLRTVTMDNRDAEAFLKPVSRTDVPDYYEVIQNPIDMQTMLKKVKQKSYKSKREFKDDLDLIWSNCYTYNATEASNHPLRQCAKRLKLKADKLLKNITDRKERTDPSIPHGLSSSGSSHKVNGTATNGIKKHRSISSVSSTKRSSASPGKYTPGISSHGKRRFRLDAPFAETPAITRSADGMNVFADLDRDPGWSEAGPSSGIRLEERLREYAVAATYEEFDSDSEDGGVEGSPMSVDGTVGDKRKMNGVSEQPRPRKRARFTQPMLEDKESVELWWDAVHSEDLIANGLPGIGRVSSLDIDSSPNKKSKNPRTPKILKSAPKSKSPSKPKRRKKPSSAPVKSLLGLMNSNIRTMKRVRSTHAKFAALNQNQNNEDGGESPEPIAAETIPEEREDADLGVDERPWNPVGSGIEIGQVGADDCLGWMSGKVLEHAGFQGTAKSAQDVLASVASDYLLNVGRTIALLSDKFANKMTPEEIILHTLFESGTTKIQDLERYIKDDVVRYGSRLGDLEKKLVGAYREATTIEALDDEDLFRIDDEEEDGAFVMGGGFGDAFGDDFLGLRELGIAEEFGMSSLSVPKKLLKGKKQGENKLSSTAALPKEPPLPYPLPPPFVPLDSKNVDHQIGLLKPYYQERFSILSNAAATLPPPPPFAVNVPLRPNASPTENKLPIALPDDPPSAVQIKIGPLGQIVRASTSGASKKKTKGKESAAAGFPVTAIPMTEPTLSGGLVTSELPQKIFGGYGGVLSISGGKKE